MPLLAWNTFRDRWPVFAGAILTVCLGVALVQSSLLALAAAATAPVPSGLAPQEALALRGAYDGASTLLGLVLALAAFVAVFIVGSTFGFTVAQRRRELALLRLIGAGPGQVRSLLLGEAVLLGAVGSALGAALGLPVARLQVWMLVGLDLAPQGFTAPWRWWVLAVSPGAGVLIAVLGVLAASRGASRVRPLEALRESGRAARVMTAPRWALGLLSTAGGAVLFALFPAGGAALPVWFVQLTPFLVSVPLVIGFSALAPLIVPSASRPAGLLLRGPLGELALSDLRADPRRSAATAAPVMVLVAFTVGIGGTLASVGEAARQEALHTVQGDLLVTADRPAAAGMAAVDGVSAVSAEAAVMLEFRFAEYGEEWYEANEGLVVDPAAYAATHEAATVAGDLADLSGAAVAVGPGAASQQDRQVGDTLSIRLGGELREVRIAALLPATVSGPAVLLSPDLAPPDAGPWRHVVRLADGADADAVAERLGAFGAVSTVEQWIGETAAASERLTLDIMFVLLGLTMLYTVIAMVNAVVIAASNRGREFAAARVTGFSRAQVVRSAFWESQVAVLVGVLLGGVAAAASILGVAVALHRLTGLTVVAVPWPLLIGLALGAAVVTGAAGVVTTLSATRTPPIRLVAARE